MGGNSPQSLVNATSLDIQAGKLDVAILAGGEAWRTFMRARKAGRRRSIGRRRPRRTNRVMIGDDLEMNLPAETERGIYMPVQVYPMFETALRAAAGRTVEEHQRHLGTLWSDLSHVAAGNEYAWIRDAKSPEEITTVTSRNRMIGLPYPKYMNSNNDVDMGAAIIMCSVEAARRLGVAEDRWVFPQSGTDCHEHTFVSHRDTFARTPAIELGGRRALELAGVGIDDIADHRPVLVLPGRGAARRGVARHRPRSASGHAPAACRSPAARGTTTSCTRSPRRDDLREQPGEHGLVWANGGYATKHAFGVYATDAAGRRVPPREATGRDRPAAAPRAGEPADAAGPATIEAYTVMFSRDGEPEQPLAVVSAGRRPAGVGFVDRRRHRRRDVRRRMGRHHRHPLRRRHPPPRLIQPENAEQSFASGFLRTGPQKS